MEIYNWEETPYSSINEMKKNNPNMFLMKAKYVKLLPTAAQMWKIFNELYYSRSGIIIRRTRFFRTRVCVYETNEIPNDLYMCWAIFKFQTQQAKEDFERAITNEMKVYLDPPKYEEHAPSK